VLFHFGTKQKKITARERGGGTGFARKRGQLDGGKRKGHEWPGKGPPSAPRAWGLAAGRKFTRFEKKGYAKSE